MANQISGIVCLGDATTPFDKVITTFFTIHINCVIVALIDHLILCLTKNHAVNVCIEGLTATTDTSVVNDCHSACGYRVISSHSKLSVGSSS